MPKANPQKLSKRKGARVLGKKGSLVKIPLNHVVYNIKSNTLCNKKCMPGVINKAIKDAVWKIDAELKKYFSLVCYMKGGRVTKVALRLLRKFQMLDYDKNARAEIKMEYDTLTYSDRDQVFHALVRANTSFCYAFVFNASDFDPKLTTALLYLWSIQDLAKLKYKHPRLLEKLQTALRDNGLHLGFFNGQWIRTHYKPLQPLDLSTVCEGPEYITDLVFKNQTIVDRHALIISFYAKTYMHKTGSTYVDINHEGFVNTLLAGNAVQRCLKWVIFKNQKILKTLKVDYNRLLFTSEVLDVLSQHLMRRIFKDKTMYTTPMLYTHINKIHKIIRDRTLDQSVWVNQVRPTSKKTGQIMLVVPSELYKMFVCYNEMIIAEFHPCPVLVLPDNTNWWTGKWSEVTSVYWLTRKTQPPNFFSGATWYVVSASQPSERWHRTSRHATGGMPAVVFLRSCVSYKAQHRPKAVSDIILDQRQEVALDKLSSAFFGVLMGPGGSGKSEIIKGLAGKKITLAFTCKARDMLRSRLGHGGDTSCHTIAHLESKLRHSDTGEKAQWLVKTQIIILDEMSMVTPRSFRYILERAWQINPLVRIICVGDINQLAHQGPGCVLQNLSDNFPSVCYTLERVHRQKTLHPTPSSLQFALSGLRNGTDWLVKNDASLELIKYSSEHMFTTSLSGILREHSTNPKRIQVIASTNNEVTLVNHIAMGLYFPVYSTRTASARSGGGFFHQDQRVITSSGHPKHDGGMFFTVKGICYPSGRKTVKWLDHNKCRELGWNRKATFLELESDAGVVKKMNFTDATECLTCSYAITVNKMQGSSCEHVVFVPARKVKSNLNLNFNRVLYTALSRAEKSAKVLYHHTYGDLVQYTRVNNWERKCFMKLLRC